MLATLASGIALCAALLGAQSPSLATNAATPTFEVASVKPNTSGSLNGSLRPGAGGRVDAVNMPLLQLIAFAYDLQFERLVGAPDWIDGARYDIVAKLPVEPGRIAAGRDPIQDVRAALRALLVDRCKRVVHQESREMDIYALVLAHPGLGHPALKPSTADCAALALAARNSGSPGPAPGDAVFCGVRVSPGRIQVGGMPLARFAGALSGLRQIGRVIVDRTGLDGNWDFDVKFAPPAPAAAAGSDAPSDANSDLPSLFTALQEQVGLKLDSVKGPVDVTVIDHLERPLPD